MSDPTVGTAAGPTEPLGRATPTAHPPPRPSPRSRTTALLSVVGAAFVLLLLVGLSYGGLTPWSHVMPGFPSHDSAPTGPVSFFDARTAAVQAAQGVSGGSWTPVEALGYVPPKAFFLNGPGPAPNYSTYYGNSSGPIHYPPPPSCWWQPIGQASLQGFRIPAAPTLVGTGLSPAWLLMFTDAAGGMLVVNVIEGVATPYVTLPGGNCTTLFGMEPYSSIASGVVDSTQASDVANSWGGSPFLANATGANETMTVIGTLTIPEEYPVEYNGTNGSGLPGLIELWNYTVPASWSISYVYGPYLSNGTQPSGAFSASLFASNATVQSVDAWMGSSGFGPCYGSYGCTYGVQPGGPEIPEMPEAPPLIG